MTNMTNLKLESQAPLQRHTHKARKSLDLLMKTQAVPATWCPLKVIGYKDLQQQVQPFGRVCASSGHGKFYHEVTLP